MRLLRRRMPHRERRLLLGPLPVFASAVADRSRTETRKQHVAAHARDDRSAPHDEHRAVTASSALRILNLDPVIPPSRSRRKS